MKLTLNNENGSSAVVTNRSLKRRSNRTRLVVSVLLALGALIFADRQGWLLVKHVDDLRAYHGRTFEVINVLSGDVIEVNAPDLLNERPTTQVRLWGIVAPQPPRPGREGEPLWQQAVAHAETLALTRNVMLQLESHRKRDPHGRVLAHVVLLDVGETLNEAMLSAGLASSDDRFPHQMLLAYAQAENRARHTGTSHRASAPVQ